LEKSGWTGSEFKLDRCSYTNKVELKTSAKQDCRRKKENKYVKRYKPSTRMMGQITYITDTQEVTLEKQDKSHFLRYFL